MIRALIIGLGLFAGSTFGTTACAIRRTVDGAQSQAATSVNERIDDAAKADAAASAVPTPVTKAQAKAADQAISRQEKVEADARLLRDAVWAFGVAALAFAIAIECPALGKPMTVIAVACVSFATICIALRAWLSVVPFVAGGGGVAALAWRLFHARAQSALAALQAKATSLAEPKKG